MRRRLEAGYPIPAPGGLGRIDRRGRPQADRTVERAGQVGDEYLSVEGLLGILTQGIAYAPCSYNSGNVRSMLWENDCYGMKMSFIPVERAARTLVEANYE